MELAHYFIKGERTDLRGGIRPPFLILVIIPDRRRLISIKNLTISYWNYDQSHVPAGAVGIDAVLIVEKIFNIAFDE